MPRLESYKKQQAFTMTEIAIVLGVIGLILAAIFWAASNLYMANEVRTANRQLEAIVQNTRTIFIEKGGIGPVVPTTLGLTKALEGLNVFPVEMRSSSSVASGIIFHGWSQSAAGICAGSLCVSADDCTGTQPATMGPCFKVTMVNLPKNACIQLATSTTSQVGLQGVAINSTTPLITTLPLSAGTATTNCTNTNNTINWTYLLRDHT